MRDFKIGDRVIYIGDIEFFEKWCPGQSDIDYGTVKTISPYFNGTVRVLFDGEFTTRQCAIRNLKHLEDMLVKLPIEFKYE